MNNSTAYNLSSAGVNSAEGVPPLGAGDIVMVVIYVTVCAVGLIGNGLAMAVVLYNPSMKSSSSIYIFNLSLSDFLFLLTLPITITLILNRRWSFGETLCKIHMGSFGVNLFTSIHTLLLMSIDRYIAMCQIRLQRFRTIRNSIISCIGIWVLAIFLILPIWLYSRMDKGSCSMEWERLENSTINPVHMFIIYTGTLGFVLPIFAITIFYSLIIAKLRSQTAPTANTNESKRARTRRVTILVLTLILVYVGCWLPYWSIQIYVLAEAPFTPTMFYAYQVATALYHINSMLNPILYGFLSETFRKGVVGTVTCQPVSKHNQGGVAMSLTKSHILTSHYQNGSTCVSSPGLTRGRLLPLTDEMEDNSSAAVREKLLGTEISDYKTQE